MLSYLRKTIDPFLIMLIIAMGLATILPVHGQGLPVFDGLTDAAIILLFFLQGAKLSREAIINGASAWRLHLAVLLFTFGIFPLLGIGLSSLPLLDPTMAGGMLFLTLLPSTVQSSIAFTSIARGNVAAAVCSASFSNLLGIALTPLLASLLMRSQGVAMSLSGAQTILLQLLLPFAVGHLLRPRIGAWVGRHKPLVTIVDRGSILLVVYTAFSAAVIEGIWHRVSPGELTVVGLCCAVLLATILTLTWLAARAMGLGRAEAIVLQFCGSKKSLVSGVPIAGILFPAAQVGMAVLPLMLFHQIQLFACAMLARHYSKTDPDVGKAASLAGATPSP